MNLRKIEATDAVLYKDDDSVMDGSCEQRVSSKEKEDKKNTWAYKDTEEISSTR